jgi:hypothetical protein
MSQIPVARADLDQAARYLRHACELLERRAFHKTAILRKSLHVAARRLGAGYHYIGNASEIIVLCQVAERVPVPAARTEILKAIAVLRDTLQ